MKTILMLSGVAAISALLTAAEPMVVRTDYNAGASWKLHSVMGKDFHPLLIYSYGGKDVLPVYNATAVSCKNYFGKCIHIDIFKDFKEFTSADQIKTNYKLEDFFIPFVKKDVMSNKKPDLPLFVSVPNARPPYFLTGKKYQYDRQDFEKWQAAHPNFIGFRVLGELDSDMRQYVGKTRKIKDPALQKAMLENCPIPKNQYEWGPMIERFFTREKAMLFGESRLWTMYSSSYIGHLMAKYGAVGIFYEATSQGVARWQIAGAFTRGASRQYDIPFGWYAAHWATSFTRDGKKTDGENNDKGSSYRYNGRYMGASRSLINRQGYYGYLIGATFLEHENWKWLHTTRDKDGKDAPSVYAKDYNELYLLSRKLERGVTYTPIAVLTPIFEQYNFLNGSDGVYRFGDLWSQNAFFYTLLPVESNHLMHHDLRKQGIEGCLFNSPFGECFDVICPDAGQPSEKLQKALSAYKCAFLIGDYRKGEIDLNSLEKYVRGGGTLFVSANQIIQGIIPDSFAGIRFSDIKMKSGRYIIGDAGARFSLKEPYIWHHKAQGEARPFLKDEIGGTAAFQRKLGKGSIITVACWKMLPAAADNARKAPDLINIVSGKQTFELIRYFLSRVHDESMPLKVEGDIQYGVNKTSNGWLLWLINNKGVKKFAFEPQELDPKATAVVRVGLKKMAGAKVKDAVSGKPVPAGADFTVKVSPGAVRLISIAP